MKADAQRWAHKMERAADQGKPFRWGDDSQPYTVGDHLRKYFKEVHASDDEEGDEADDQGKLDGVGAAPVAQQGDDVILKIRQHAYLPSVTRFPGKEGVTINNN